MIRSILTASLLLLALDRALAFPLPDPDEGERRVPVLVASQETEERQPGPADLDEAIEIAIERYGGRAANADTVVRDGRRVHEIRLLNEEDGTVRTVRIDPNTGAIIPPPRR